MLAPAAEPRWLRRRASAGEEKPTSCSELEAFVRADRSRVEAELVVSRKPAGFLYLVPAGRESAKLARLTAAGTWDALLERWAEIC